MKINDLHRKTLEGGKNAEKELFEALAERFRLILQHKVYDKNDVEDLLQDSLMAVSSKYKNIEFESSFSAWAYKVLEYNLYSYYRSAAGKRKRETGMSREAIESQVIASDPMLKMKLMECFEKMCNNNERYASVIGLHYEGFKIEEISKKLKVTVNNVYVLMSRARTMLKNCLDSGELS